MNQSKLLILSGFSGVGKGEVCKRIQGNSIHEKSIEIVKSVTTRSPRHSKEEYIFVSAEEFEDMRKNNRFFENASYNGYRYGTLLTSVNEILAKDSIPCLEINHYGFEKITKGTIFSQNQIRSVFLVAPAEVIVQRLLHRGTDGLSKIIERLEASIEKSRHLGSYDAVILNNNIASATNSVLKVFAGGEVVSSFNPEQYRKDMEPIIERLKTVCP